jgi:hypothetical protein
MKSEIEISQFIATKLSHDLAGVVGAIGSGIDFLNSENPEMREKAYDLLKTSSEQTINRLVFFRYTYGISKYSGEANLDEIKKVACDYLKGTKVTLDFHEKFFHIHDVYVSTNLGKLILCIIQLAYLSLIHGGEIKVVIDKGTKNTVTISAIGKSPKVDEEKNNIINGKSGNIELTTQNCLSHYAKVFSNSIKVELSVIVQDKEQIDYKIIF